MQELIQKKPFEAYLILAFGITWVGSLIYVFAGSGRGAFALPGAVVWYYGPCLAAILLTARMGGMRAVKKLGARLLQWRFGFQWYVFIFVYPLLLHLGVVCLDWYFGGPPPVFLEAAGVPEGNRWSILLGLVLLHVFLRGIGEETGWRGYALPRALETGSELRAGLKIGFFWALWHLHPANFSALLSTGGMFILSNILLTSVIFTYLYVRTGRSLFAAVLFHMTLNVVEYIVPTGFPAADFSRQVYQVLFILLTILLLFRISTPRKTTPVNPAPL